jgi:hypothetical protein
MKYGFSLVLTAEEVTEQDADRLYEAGCSDGSILTRNGVTSIQFDRRAASLEEAIRSAVANVESAGLQVARVEIERSELATQA